MPPSGPLASNGRNNGIPVSLSVFNGMSAMSEIGSSRNHGEVGVAHGPAVAVVITTYNHAHFLAEAIASVEAQTHPAAMVVVVDDGSTDDPARIVAQFPRVQLVRQDNQGLAATRNTGLHEAEAEAEYVTFLDADDRLLPDAISAGLACFATFPGSAFVYGAHRRIDQAGGPIGGTRYEPVETNGYSGLLGGNRIGMHATVLYRCDALRAVGGFDAVLRRCEDYDLYLRLARSSRIASHPTLVAEYRWHDMNMSHDLRAMLRSVLAVHGRQRTAAATHPETLAAWQAGRRNWISYYEDVAMTVARSGSGASRAQRLAAVARVSPRRALDLVASAARDRAAAALPFRLARWLPGYQRLPPIGQVNFGDFGRPGPNQHGFRP